MQLFWANWEEINGAERFERIGLDEVALYRDYDIKPIEAAFYVQDKLELGDDIIVNAGLRLDILTPTMKSQSISRPSPLILERRQIFRMRRQNTN